MSRALLLFVAVALCASTAAAQTFWLIAELDNAQVVPPTGSPARGTAVFTLDPAINRIDYEFTFEGLTGAQFGARISLAPAGSNGGLLASLGSGQHKTGSFSYSEALEQSFLTGRTYISIHSTAEPFGEIRGQILRSPGNATLVAHLDGAQSGTASPAVGTGWFSMDFATNAIDFSVTVTDSLLLGGEVGADIHGFATYGQSAGVKLALPTGFHKRGTWVYPESDELGILSELTYVDVHTTTHPGGEIRAQLTVESLCDPLITSYCTAGASASGCTATLSASGIPSATLSSGFLLNAVGVEGQKGGLFFFGFNGGQASAWGNGTSFQCVTPPVFRAGFMPGTGTAGACDGSFSQDLNAHWTAKPASKPVAGTLSSAQLWYRDPGTTSNQTTSLSDAIGFVVCP